MPFGFAGTFGAVIRIRQPLTTKAKVFDVGVAGPFAGFLVAVPALLVGLAMSTVAPLPPVFSGAELGEPLLFKAAEWLVWGAIPDHLSLNLHPMAFAAWIGLLVTALNLLPVGQLDGGHIAYAAFGRHSLYVTIGTIAVAIGLCFYSSSWMVWTGLLVAMLTFFGWRHPRAWDDHVPLNRTRLWLALVALDRARRVLHAGAHRTPRPDSPAVDPTSGAMTRSRGELMPPHAGHETGPIRC